MRPGAETARISAERRPGRPVRYGRFETGAGQETKKRLPWPVVLFLVGLVIPWIIPLGPLNLSVYRFVLLGTLLPCLAMWARGQAGPIRASDIGLFLFSGWVGLTLIVAHGPASGTQSAGIFFIETMGAYLLARCYIRDAEDFENMIDLMVKIVVLLLPFAIYEWFTGGKPILSAFGVVFPTVEITMMEPRLGFWRVQGPFDHSIQFGIFCGSIFALAYLTAGTGRRAASRKVMAVLAAVTAFLSLSSAPIAGLVMQSALICWNWVLKPFKSRWLILCGLVLAAYLVVEFGSNQTPVKFYISRFTFDGSTGWHRLAIWEFGSASVLNHPLFGIGFGDWERPKWLVSDSVDNFWLILAMRHGLPAFFLFLAQYLWVIISVSLKKTDDEKLQNYKVAYIICLAVYSFVGTTVHIYAAPYAWFVFLLGSGVWMLDVKPGEAAAVNETDPGMRRRLPPGRRGAVRPPRPGRAADHTRKA